METLMILLIVFSYCHRIESIDPDYNLFSRVKEFVRLFTNTIDDYSVNYGRSLNNNNYYRNRVTFWCSKTNHTNTQQVLINDKNVKDKINLKKPLAIFIHGWTDNTKRLWFKRLIKYFARYTNYNVCGVDWSRLALVKYSLAATNTRIVSMQLHLFIQHLMTVGLKVNKLILIGHSMGAQIAGQTGKHFHGKLPHIIGLDPAGWLFTKPSFVDDNLNQTDAKFVQCIHTDNAYFGLGSTFDTCHQDYYPNGGLNPQPGCHKPILENGIALLPFVCSHYKAVEYFQYSLNPDNKFQGVSCPLGYRGWINGRCKNNNYDNFGIYARQSTVGKLYLKTTIYPPYSIS